ncbi:MFS transporter [Sphingosinicella microcystinivorans]|uniref:MFS transporter n=1 Tax=Sphingosinicella microcystinivorans TaxID=335406 RepID=UPI0022F3BBE5|nr:MFS transporter [Sphingosinicella microcystinivorans]WBX85452.1 MFS transporter [Sphingosinicella microcystinivorans]
MGIPLLAARRFGPLFATQFLGAFNDNFYKTAMLFLITYTLLAGDTAASAQIVTLAAGVFILPFVLFSALAGQIADSVDKARLVRIIKAAEIGIMLVGAAALTLGSVPLMMLVLFSMGLHSTFFGPIKYAILPQHLAPKEVLTGTGLVEAGTFVAILTGQVAGGLLATEVSAWAIVAVAVFGYLSGRQVPAAPPPGRARIEWNILASALRITREVTRDPQLGRAVLAVSWFWSVGAVFTSLFVPLVKGDLGGAETVATLFLTIFSVGVATGSLVVARLLKGAVSVRYAPASAVLMTAFIADLYFAIRAFDAPHAELIGVGAFLADPESWRIVLDLFGLSVAAGAFIVPLYALLQTASDPSARARTIAANNIVNSGFMVAAALGSSVLLKAGLDVPQILLAVGLANLLIVIPCLRIHRIRQALGTA